MKIEGEGQLLRIFVGESDRWEGRPLYEAIVRAAREQGLAGATALRGIEGFGASSRIHTVKILRLSEDLPVVVEIVDRADRIQQFLPTLDKIVREGMVTLEKVNVVMYRHRPEEQPGAEDEIPLDTSDFEPGPADRGGLFSTATDRVRKIIELAQQEAGAAHRVHVDSVDVLLGLLSDRRGLPRAVLTAVGIDVHAVERLLREEVSRDPQSDEFIAALDAKSRAEAKWLGHNYVGTEHVLMALCEIRPSPATDVLMRLGAQPREICKGVLEILGHDDDWQRWLADHPEM